MTIYSGKFKEDLDGVVESSETLTDICVLINDQKKQEIPFMLKGNNFCLCAKNKHGIESYKEGIKLIRGWYTSKGNRIDFPTSGPGSD